LVGASLPLRAVNPVGPQQAMPPALEAMDRVRATRVSTFPRHRPFAWAPCWQQP
jgi:hypothetical protein